MRVAEGHGRDSDPFTVLGRHLRFDCLKLRLYLHLQSREVDLGVRLLEANVRNDLFVMQHHRDLDETREEATTSCMSNVGFDTADTKSVLGVSALGKDLACSISLNRITDFGTGGVQLYIAGSQLATR